MQNLFAASAHKCPMCRAPLARSDLLLVHPLDDNGPDLNFGSKIAALCEMVRTADDDDKFLVVLQFQGSTGPIRSALRDHAKVYSLREQHAAVQTGKEPGGLRGGRGKGRLLAFGAGRRRRRQPHGREPRGPFRALSGQGAREQSVGRAHRMGQCRPVQVQTLVTTGTIEEKIVAEEGNCRMSHVCQFFTDDD